MKLIKATNLELAKTFYFKTSKQASVYLSCDPSVITKILKGKLASSWGWTFEEVEGDFEIVTEDMSKTPLIYERKKKAWNKDKENIYKKEVLDKMRKAKLGKKASEETRSKLSASLKKYYSEHDHHALGTKKQTERKIIKENKDLEIFLLKHTNYNTIDYKKLYELAGSYRKAAKAIGLTKSKFMVKYKKQLQVCTGTTECLSPPEEGYTRCRFHLDKTAEGRDIELKKAYSKTYIEKNRVKLNKKRKEWYHDNREDRAEYRKRYGKENPGKIGEWSSKKRAAKLKAIPKWYDKEKVNKLYELCPTGYQVDHIIPLIHEYVCGLHTHENLQILPANLNAAKGNSFDGTYDNKSWMQKYSHQFIRRLETTMEDIKSRMPFNSKIRDYKLAREDISNEHKEFIKRYEWLGTMGWNNKWCFTARYIDTNALTGVILLSEPLTNSKNFEDKEALIQRGAAASWAPKNLNSKLIMFALKWMIKNTKKRVFTGYSDPEAGEIGTIYQACNFKYLGASFGGRNLYILKSGKEVTEKYFNRTATYKKHAALLGISWKAEWQKENGFKNLKAIPIEVLNKIKNSIRSEKAEARKIPIPRKGKYIIWIGVNKREQIELDEKYAEIRPKKYPKRGVE